MTWNSLTSHSIVTTSLFFWRLIFTVIASLAESIKVKSYPLSRKHTHVDARTRTHHGLTPLWERG